MKNLSLLLLSSLIILISNFIQAQDYVPFPTDNATWRVHHFSAFGGSSIIETKMTGDTIFNNKNYQKIYQNVLNSGNPDSMQFQVGLREEEKKIYVINPDIFEEILLYDFTKEAGDSVTFTTFNPSFPNIITLTKKIESVDSILMLDGSYRKRFFFPAFSYHPDEYWIEGIGSTISLLTPHLGLSDNSFDLWCFSENENLIYSSLSPETNCAQITSINSISKENSNFQVFPNPTSHFINIKSKNQIIDNILIFDLLGHPVFKERNINDKTMELDVSEFVEGIYFLKINFDQNKHMIEKISILRN